MSASHLRLLALTLFLALPPLAASAQALAPAFSAAWIDVPVPGSPALVHAPRDAFAVVAVPSSFARGRAGSGAPQAQVPATVYAGEAWLRDGRAEAAAIADATVATLTQWARRTGAPIHAVVGRYQSENALLAVDVYRAEQGPGGTPVVMRMPFTPHHGGYWAAARRYLTAAEAQADPQRPGRNPFARFAGASTDPLFHQIDEAAAEVVLGHAMSRYRAPIGALAVVSLDVQTTQTHSGGWLRRTYTTTQRVLARTQWRVATPPEAQPWASPQAFCVADLACADSACSAVSCPDAALVASSGAVFDDWTGQALAGPEEQLAAQTTSSKSWTVLGQLLAGSLAGLDPVVATNYLANGAGSPLQAAPGTVIGPIGDGHAYPPATTDAFAQSALAAAATRTLGPEGQRLAAVASGEQWIAPRPQSRTAAEGAGRLDLLRIYRLCQQRGYVGEALRRCAAPPAPLSP